MIKVSKELSKLIKDNVMSNIKPSESEVGKVEAQYINDLEKEVDILKGSNCRLEREIDRYRRHIANEEYREKKISGEERGEDI